MRIVSILLLTICTAVAGCVSSKESKVFTRDQARVTHRINFGTVLQVEPVTIEGTRSGVGAVGGAVAGGVLGSLVGGGRGRTVATVGGALGGAALGAAGEEAATRRSAIEILIEMDDGDIVSIVQEPDETFIPGDRVRVLSAPDGSVRVRR
jgi:outer membrane lipoprotein SlyB